MSGSYRVTTAGPSGHVEHHIHIRTMRMCLDLSPIQMFIQKHVEILCRNPMPESYERKSIKSIVKYSDLY